MKFRLGRLTTFLWSGSWSWLPEILECAHCKNVYFGPFGFEWEV